MKSIINKPKRFISYSVSAFVLSAIYVLILITLYFFLNSEPITWQTFFNFHLKNPFLFLLEIMPFLVWFAMSVFVGRIAEDLEDIEQELRIVQKRREAIYQFVENLRQGRSDVDFSNEFARDKLMDALIKLRDEINKSRQEEEQRKKEDMQRHWVSEGLAKFSAILRENIDNLQKLAEEITSNLTKYVDAKQAAFFLIKETDDLKKQISELEKKIQDITTEQEKLDKELEELKEASISKQEFNRQKEIVESKKAQLERIKENYKKEIEEIQAFINEFDQERYLEMIAFFAYDRKKFASKKIGWGEGLVGAVAIESKTIVLNETSDNFVEITSGLGSANPRAIIIAPLKDDDGEVHGVIELASFNPYEDYQVEFIEQVAQSIGDTIANIKINLRTQALLEESQKQAEKLALQEEEMRRSVEELKITQQEAAKQSEEFISFTNSVNKALIRAEFTKEGFLIFANDKFLQHLGYKDYISVANKHITQFLDEEDRNFFEEHWEKLSNSSDFFDGDLRFATKDGQQKWFSVSFIGVRSASDEVFKILLLGLDRTEEKNIHQQYVTQIELINRAILRLEFTTDAKLITANNNFYTKIGYTPEQTNGREYLELLSIPDNEDFDLLWRNILSGQTYSTVTHLQDSEGNELWFELYHSAIIINKKPVKVILFGFDITEKVTLKHQIKLLHQENDKLSKELESERKKFEEEKQNLNKVLKVNKTKRVLLEETFENMDKAVVSIDQSGHIVIFNKRAEDLWKIKRDVVLGKRLVSILPELQDKNIDDLEYLLSYFNSTMPVTGTYRLSYIIDKNSKRVNVRVFIVMSKFEEERLITAFIQPMV